MRLQSVEINGFKSFAKKAQLSFDAPVTAIVGPNGSGKSNVAESFRFVLGEQSVKSLRGKKGEDLIFGGGKTLARQNRASVKVVFKNNDRRLPIDFDEVSLERIVHRDGFNEYLINGSKVRLKDITELLAHANIGASGHHIISQGEADRILSASPQERREMIEDALGLKIYHYRKKESIKKLEKTADNIKQVESLRREITPHLTFLKKQVEKLEKARELKDKLVTLCLEYFKREALYISFTKKTLTEEKRGPEHELTALEKKLHETERVIAHAGNHTQNDDLVRAEAHLRDITEQKETVSRDLWKIEGELSAIARLQAQEQSTSAHTAHDPKHVAFKDVESFAKDIEDILNHSEQQSDIHEVVRLLKKAHHRISEFFDHVRGKQATAKTVIDTSHLEKQKVEIEHKLTKLTESLHEAQNKVDEARRFIAAETVSYHEAERAVYEIKAAQNAAIAKLSDIRGREARLADTEAQWKRDLAEAAALAGHAITGYEAYAPKNEENHVLSHEDIVAEARAIQDDRKRSIERIKIRLEDAGLGTGEDVFKEYKETSERDEFLKKELLDLSNASVALAGLIADLDVELTKRFDEGIIKINDSFGEFFTTMFGGGEARLDLLDDAAPKSKKGDDDEESIPESLGDDEEKEAQPGIDVYVALPHKRTKGLVMLSGGERALTSIALLFALSQVTPPPFIILDETDAALDEANSRKYGDMIESLAKRSQLILITHNRETMSRASMLYGVTMASEGFSTLLSIKFDDAVKVAK